MSTPPGREPYSNEEMIAALASHGRKISAPYVSQLRTGQRRRPSQQKVDAIAEFFGVRSSYFADQPTSYRRAVEADLDGLELARNAGIRELTMALAELEPAVRERLMTEAGI